MMKRDSTAFGSSCRHEDCAEYRLRGWQQPLSRRTLLKGAMGVAAMGATSSQLLLQSTALARMHTLRPGAAPSAPILVVIQQAGGNDGLNTVIPFASSRYYELRPTLAIPADQALHLDATAGFHPNLTGLKQLYDAGNLAVVQGVGYPNPDLSHFKSIINWQTGTTTGALDSGWLGRYIDTALGADPNPLKAISIGALLPMAFRSATNSTPAIQDIPSFQLSTESAGYGRNRILQTFREINAAHDTIPTYAAIRTAQTTTQRAIDGLQAVPTGYQSTVTYPTSYMGTQLQLVAQLIHADLGTRVFWVEQDGYDDHAREAGDHAQLLRDLDQAVSAFHADMAARGWDRQILLMTWSEFGRRVQENGDRGTDHGTAAPMLVIGGNVRGGVYGDDPVLTALDGDGNLVHTIDYRSVYRTIIERWMGADPAPVVGTDYPALPFL